MFALLCVLSSSASAQSASRSVGTTAGGRLIDGVELVDTPAHHGNGRAARWGTAELVELIDGATAAVQRAVPGTPSVATGDLSRRRGGRAPPHASHRSGRDADIGFYYLGREGEPLRAQRFVRLLWSGRCASQGGLECRLDARRTWRLMAALVRGRSRVQYILIAPHIRQLLLAEATRVGADQDTVARFRLVTSPIRGSREHVNHMHLRIYCAPDDRPRCADEGPLHPWYEFTPGTPEEFVARARERGQRMLAAEVAREAVDRAQRERALARRQRALDRVAAQRQARLDRIARAQARRTAAAEAAGQARAERIARANARRAASVAAASQARAERIAQARARRAAASEAQERRSDARGARHAAAAARGHASPRAEAPSRSERIARHRARAAAEEAERARRLAAYRALAEARRQEVAANREARRVAYRAREAELARADQERRDRWAAHVAASTEE